MRASHIQGSALKFIAEQLSGPRATPAQQQAAEGRLEEAMRVLESGAATASQQMQKLAHSKIPAAQEQLDEIVNLYVELQVLLLEVIDVLCGVLGARGGSGEKVAQLQAKAEALANSLAA